MEQENHERNPWQLAESVGKDNVKRMYSDPEYWRNYSIQERNINKLFSSTVDLARRIEKGTLSMIDFGIEYGSMLQEGSKASESATIELAKGYN